MEGDGRRHETRRRPLSAEQSTFQARPARAFFSVRRAWRPKFSSSEELLDRVARLERLPTEKDRRIAELEGLLEQGRRGDKRQAAPPEFRSFLPRFTGRASGNGRMVRISSGHSTPDCGRDGHVVIIPPATGVRG